MDKLFWFLVAFPAVIGLVYASAVNLTTLSRESVEKMCTVVLVVENSDPIKPIKANPVSMLEYVFFFSDDCFALAMRIERLCYHSKNIFLQFMVYS